MKKKILTLLFSLILCLCIVTPAFAAQTDGFASEYERVQDLAGLLSGNEESSLVTKLDELSERQKMDIVVLTTDTLDGKTPRDYADDIYDYGNFGYGESKDGALLLISIEDNDWYISTCGYGITAFTDAGIEYIGKQIKGDLSDGNFAGAFDKFADLCDDFITQARTGEPYDVKNLPKEPLSLIWINSPPDSRRLGIIINTTANKIPNTRTALKVRQTGLASFTGAFLHTLFQQRSSGFRITLIRNAIPPPIRNGENSEITFLRNSITALRFIKAQANRISSSNARMIYRTMFLSSRPFSGGAAISRRLVSVSVPCGFFAMFPPRCYCAHSKVESHCLTVMDFALCALTSETVTSRCCT